MNFLIPLPNLNSVVRREKVIHFLRSSEKMIYSRYVKLYGNELKKKKKKEEYPSNHTFVIRIS
jgi:hypothetical protein